MQKAKREKAQARYEEWFAKKQDEEEKRKHKKKEQIIVSLTSCNVLLYEKGELNHNRAVSSIVK